MKELTITLTGTQLSGLGPKSTEHIINNPNLEIVLFYFFVVNVDLNGWFSTRNRKISSSLMPLQLGPRE